MAADIEAVGVEPEPVAAGERLSLQMHHRRAEHWLALRKVER